MAFAAGVSELFDEKFENVEKAGTYSVGFKSSVHFVLGDQECSLSESEMESKIFAYTIIEPLSMLFDHPNLIRPLEVRYTEFGIVRKYKKMLNSSEVFSSLSKIGVESGQVTTFFLEFIKHISEGLEHMHRQGFIHSDIKPANILFDTGTSKFVIIDFNIMQFVGPTGFRDAESYGSAPCYDEREQCGFLSDIRALGKTVEALYGTVDDYKSPLIEMLIGLMTAPLTTRIYFQDLRHILDILFKSKTGSGLRTINPKLRRNLKYYRQNYKNTVFTELRKLAGGSDPVPKSTIRQAIRTITGFEAGSPDARNLYPHQKREVADDEEYIKQENKNYLKLVMKMWSYKRQ